MDRVFHDGNCSTAATVQALAGAGASGAGLLGLGLPVPSALVCVLLTVAPVAFMCPFLVPACVLSTLLATGAGGFFALDSAFAGSFRLAATLCATLIGAHSVASWHAPLRVLIYRLLLLWPTSGHRWTG